MGTRMHTYICICGASLWSLRNLVAIVHARLKWQFSEKETSVSRSRLSRLPAPIIPKHYENKLPVDMRLLPCLSLIPLAAYRRREMVKEGNTEKERERKKRRERKRERENG